MSPPDRDDPALWPRFCCAILRDPAGRYLLERRSDADETMPGQLVCFGGGRDTDEDPDACIRRELLEELGCDVPNLEPCVRLLGAGNAIIAWFYRARAPAVEHIRTEHGVAAVWAGWDEFPTLPIGNWNLAAMIAEREGRGQAIVEA